MLRKNIHGFVTDRNVSYIYLTFLFRKTEAFLRSPFIYSTNNKPTVHLFWPQLTKGHRKLKNCCIIFKSIFLFVRIYGYRARSKRIDEDCSRKGRSGLEEYPLQEEHHVIEAQGSTVKYQALMTRLFGKMDSPEIKRH